MNQQLSAKRPWRSGRIWLAGVIALALVWILHDLDFDRFIGVVASANPAYLVLVPVAVLGEQWARTVTWRQVLHGLKPIATTGLFGTLMASYFANLIVPGISSLVRAWLAARRAGLKVTAVLATVAIERLIGGIVVAALAPFTLMVIEVPDPSGLTQSGLIGAAAISFALFAILLCALAGYRAIGRAGWLASLARRLPTRLGALAGALALAFAEGIVWPKERARRFGIVLASVAMKLIAATQLMWAGLAFGVHLAVADYLFLLVFLSLVHAFSISARMLGGFTVGAVIALGLFQVPKEQALAMALVVQGSSLLTVAGLGGLVLWLQGIGIGDLREAWLRLGDAVPADLPTPAAQEQQAPGIH
ncbi:MAG TPA: lysylphosphatidylglycerol synthase transmembrane domain-containing protein [Dongiaceae bacterium]